MFSVILAILLWLDSSCHWRAHCRLRVVVWTFGLVDGVLRCSRGSCFVTARRCVYRQMILEESSLIKIITYTNAVSSCY